MTAATPRSGFCPVDVAFVDLDGLHARLLDGAAGLRVVLVADRQLVGVLRQERLARALAARFDLAWVDRVRPNPTQADIVEALRSIGTRRPERIVAVGGGSAIDLAKAVSASHALFRDATPSVGDVTRMLEEKSYRNNASPIPITVVPTTAGTGSEMTRWATIWDVNKEAKHSIDDSSLYPQLALIAPELTCSMPRRLTLSTGLDALSHAMEAFWARASSPVVKDVAVMAMLRIRRHLRRALDEPEDATAREALSRGAALAGMAFSNTRTTACHSMSYPMTMLFGVDHGFACAMTLRQVATINRSAVPEIDGMLEEVFGGAAGFDEWIESVCDGVQPLALSAFGIGSADIPRLAGAAFTAGRMDNNPVDLTPEQVRSVLGGCLDRRSAPGA